ncbi:MAG: hypothetical protein ACTSRZ_17335 [Promethearchaeota archaeon]
MIQKYEGWMLAKSTITHFGNEKTGSTPVLRTIYMYIEGQGEIPFPYVNGNAIRGKLRRLLMRDFFQLLDIQPELLNTKVYHTFFTGGALESTEETYGAIDLELRREIRRLFPPLALLGCAIGNQMIPGKLKVGHAFPVCSEYLKYLPEDLVKDERVKMSVRTFTDESFQTRRDDLKAEREEDEQATQMKVDYECFVPGTKFYHWFVLEYPNKMDKSCFGRCMNLFRQAPYIGGMSAIGNGEIIFDYKPEFPSDKDYLNFVKAQKNDIGQLITKLTELL